MPSKEDLSDQLSLTQKLVSAVEQMAKNMERVEASYDSQIAAVEKLTKVMESLKGQDLGGLNQIKLDDVQKEVQDTEKNIKSLTGRMKDLGKTVGKNLSPAMAAGVGALAGLAQGLRTVAAASKVSIGLLSSFASGAFSLAASIISIPFKMFEGLVSMAAEASGGSNELATALENLREAMGDLKGPGTHAVLEASNTLKGFSDTGLSAWRVFGSLAERIEYFTKLAVAMGSTFGVLKNEFIQNGGAIAAYQKALGISEEQMKSVGDRAITMGESMSKTFLDMAKQTLSLGKAFDIDQKLIGRDMAKAAADVKHFGAVSVKEIGQASVYARKLGVELDKIVGTLDQFETFDSAAESAAKLSQSFGVSVDAFKLMDAQNPADQLDMLRKSFRDAGVDASSFTRQQAKLLAMTTGLDEATAKQVFSSKNYGVSLDDIKKKSESAEKKTLTQAEAMKDLADSIKRMVQGGGDQLGSYWQQFVKGFFGGIQATKEFRDIMMNIKQGLHLVYMEGVRLGQAFVANFPGVQKFLSGIADFFKPEKFQQLTKKVVDILVNWMKELNSDGGKASFSTLMKNIQEKFFDFFNSQSPAGKKVVESFKTIMTTLSKIVTEGIKWASGQLAEGIKWITSVIRDPSKLINTAGSAAGSALGFVSQLLSPIIKALYESWVEVWPAVKDLFYTVGKKLYEYIISDEFLSIIKPAAIYVAEFLFGMMFAKAIMGAITASIAKGATSLLSGASGIMKQVVAKASSIGSMGAAPKFAEKLPPVNETQQVAESGKAMASAGQNVSWGSVLKFLVAFAGVLTIGMAAIFGAVAIIRNFNIKQDELVMALGTVAAAAVAMLPAAVSLAIISKFPLDAGSAALGILAIGTSIAVMVGVLALTYVALKDLDMSKLKVIGESLVEMSKVFLMASGIILVATGIGAAITASAGVGAAVAAVGLGAIVAAVGVMAGSIVTIMKMLEGVSVGGGFSEKVKAFTNIMDSLVNFAKNFASMLDAIKPSFVSILTGGDDTNKRIEKLTIMLDTFIGRPGQGGGMIGIVEKVIWAVQQLSFGGPKMLESAKMFADIMSSMTGLASALKPPDKMFEAINGMWTTSDDVLKSIDKVTEFAGKVTSGVKDLINVFMTQVMPIVTAGGSGLSDQQIKGAAAVGQLLGAVTQIARGMTPSEGTIAAMREQVGGIIGHDDTFLRPENMEALGNIVKNISEGLTKVLPAVIGSLTPVLNAIGQWHFSESDAAVFKSVGPMLGQMIVMVQSIVAQSSQFAQAKLPGPNVTAFLDKLGEVMPKFMQSVANSLPELFKGLKSGILQLSQGLDPKALESGMKSFAGIMGVVAEVPKMMQSLKGMKEGGDIKGTGFAMATTIHEIAWFFDKIIKSGVGAGDAPLVVLAEALSNPIVSSFNSLKASIETIKSVMTMIGDVGNVIKNIQALVPQGTANVGDKLALAMNEIAYFFDKIIKSGVGAGEPPLQLLMSSLKVMNSFDTKSAVENVNKLGTFMKQIVDDNAGGIPLISAAAANMNTYAKTIASGGIIPALDAVSKMVAAANDLDAALSDGNINKLDVKAKLSRVATAVGLGGKAQVTINNKMAQINVHMTVEMNAADLEKAMILRANSFVRQRLDFLSDKSGAKPALGGEYNSTQSGVPALSATGP